MSLPNKASDVDCIPIFVLKHISMEISVILSDIFNDSIVTGIFPECLKLSRLIPIFKAVDRMKVNNYRPIAMLETLSKIFEKLMKVRMCSFIDKHKILSNCQFGFRKGKCTSDAVLELVNDGLEAVDAGRVMISVFIDLKKAFDTVNHNILISKMYSMGFRGTILNWFKSYLKDRTIFVDIDGTFSNKKSINIGVPQGSVSGPLLFLLYINDMCTVSKKLKFTHFADDTTVSMVGDDVSDLCVEINQELSKIESWLNSNRLMLNAEKSSYMIFSLSDINDASGVVVGNSVISRVNSASFLGLTIDSKFKFTDHIDKLTLRLSRAVGIMFKMTPLVPFGVLRNLYFALLYPHITYGVTVWGRSSIVYVNRVKVIQRRALRLLSASYDHLSVSTDYMTFDMVFEYYTLIKFFKCMYSDDHHVYFNDRIVSLTPDHGYSTRFSGAHSLCIPWYNKVVGQRFFLYQSVVLWNDLPILMKNAGSFSEFKRLLRKYVLSKDR